MSLSPGAKFRLAIEQNNPLQIVGTINPYCAMMAKNLGHQAIYLSGGGIANASYGLPDLGITTLNDVLVDVDRITNACDLPLLVDIDTGFGGAFNIARTIKAMEKAGAAAVHMEDQVAQKRCGHRPNKAIVSQQEMVDRVKAAVDARNDESFVIMARTDALAVEGMDSAIERAQIIQQTITNQVSEQLNQRMYVMSVVAALFLPLGFLTGLLGVNVGGIPGTESPYAFSAFVLFLIVLTGGIGVYFKSKKWL